MPDVLTLDDLDLEGAKVLVRSDLNVPLEDGAVGDDFRIRMALPTIERIREEAAVVAVCSHLGRPKGEDPSLSMEPVATRLSELGGFDVTFVRATHGDQVVDAIRGSSSGDVLVLENTRFEPGETKNDSDLASAMSTPFDLFVQDAFGSVHRTHASTVGVAERLESAAGPLLVSELEALGRLTGDPDRPYSVILGGAKVSDKLGVIRNLLPRVDTMLIGGGMCFTVMRAQGHDVGESMVEEDQIDTVGEILAGPDADKIQLPIDIVIAEEFDREAKIRTVAVERLEKGWMGLDIGPDTSEAFAEVIARSASVFWNGPMGVFEWPRFRDGTGRIARAMAEADAYTVAGGGDTASALRMFGYEKQVSHLSTGGGAGLELLEGSELPGVEVLKRWT